jgi:hypothetical protein
MKGFREFVDKEKYVATVKKQLGVPKKIWLGMPLLLSNTKLGNRMIGQPTMFYVTNYDKNSVTLSNATEPGSQEREYDADDELDLDKSTVQGKIEITVSMQDFYKLQEPQVPPGGGDTGMMGGMV